MKRTVKIWLAAVMSGVLLAGGAAMTGQAPWGMEAQAHSGRTDASGGHRDNKNASAGKLSLPLRRSSGTPASQWSVSLCRRRGKYPDPDPGPDKNPDTSPDSGTDPGTGPGADSDPDSGPGCGPDSFRGRRSFRYFGLASEWGILELYLRGRNPCDWMLEAD